MTSYTPNYLLTLQADGDNPSTWGDVCNLIFGQIDQALGGYLAISVAGSSNVTLTQPNGTSVANQANNPLLKFTGALTGNITVFWPVSETRWMMVWNATSGAYTLTAALVGTPGATVAVPQGTRMLLWTDGTNVYNSLSSLGPVTMSSGATIAGGASVTGGMYIDTITGGEHVVSGLTVAGGASLAGGVIATGAMGVSGGLNVDAVAVSGNTTVTGTLSIGNATTSSATAGAASSLPSLPSAYVDIVVGGVSYKIPAYS